MLATLILSALAAPAAQADGVVLQAKVDPGANCNDIWGFVAPNGDEYALVGTTSGLVIYNCVDPQNPYQTAYIPGPPSLWRDVKAWGNYVYVVTEGGGGIQIVDMNDPENPFLVKTWKQNDFTNAHNIAIDEGTGMIYVCGTNRGTRIYDASASATSPPYVGTYNNEYVHDLHIQDGWAHLAEIYDGRYRIIDVNNLPNTPTRDRQSTPGQFTHSAWASEDNTLCMTTDEVSGGRVALYDISNKTNIQYLDQWTPNVNTIPHNAFILGDYAYVSWYTEGLIVLDISDPNEIKKYASYDTSPYNAGAGFHGAWGVYPFQPSGNIYISDMEEGFYILKVEGPAIDLEHTELSNTQDEVGPYPVTVNAQPKFAGSTVTGVDLWYRVDQGSWQQVALSQIGSSDDWTGDIPGQPSASVVEYYFNANESGGRNSWLPNGTAPGSISYSFYVGVPRRLYFNDFEGSTDEGWTHGASQGNDDFERGVPKGKTGAGSRHESTRWYDPDVAFSGSKIWGNDLGTGFEDGAYNENASMWLQSPTIDCSTSANTTLIFRRWASFEGGGFDSARIVVNGNQVWVSPQYSGEILHITDRVWTQMVIDISDYADGVANTTIRFELDSDAAFHMGGWGIDDVEVVALEAGEPTDTITLTGPTSAAAGSNVVYQISTAPANRPYYLAYSLNLNGSVILGHNIDLGSPYVVADQGQTDAQGTATVNGTLPAGAAGVTIYLEAVGVTPNGELRDSPPLTLSIQ